MIGAGAFMRNVVELSMDAVNARKLLEEADKILRADDKLEESREENSLRLGQVLCQIRTQQAWRAGPYAHLTTFWSRSLKVPDVERIT
jgi:hypothetical protein